MRGHPVDGEGAVAKTCLGSSEFFSRYFSSSFPTATGSSLFVLMWKRMEETKRSMEKYRTASDRICAGEVWVGQSVDEGRPTEECRLSLPRTIQHAAKVGRF